MILLIPIGLILAASLAIIIQNRVYPKFGTSWIIASVSMIIAWVMIFYLRLRLPSSLELLSWQGAEVNLLGHFSLLLDYNSWPYALALITVTLAVILTDAARTRYDSTPTSWSASLFITALGLLALQSGTGLTLMVAWVVVDLYELFYLLRLKDSSRFLLRIIISFGVRTGSILVLILATTQGWQINPNFDLTQIPQQAGFFFLLAAGLRLGVFPLNLPFLQEPNLRRGAGNIIRLAPVASSLSLLSRLPAGIVPEILVGWMPVFEAMLSFAALYAAIRWLTAGDEIEGRPFWIIVWAAFATASVLNGAPAASLAWGLALILPGSLLFLYFPRIQRMDFLMWFGLLGLIGLPYTPLASGWGGLTADGLTLWTFLFLLAHALTIMGYLDRGLQPSGQVGMLESWARLVYPLGLILIIQAMIALGLIGWPGSLTAGVWWLPLVSNGLVIAAVILIRRYEINPPYIRLPASSSIAKVLNWVLPRLEPIFRFEWIYRIVWQINNFIGKVLQGISIILEGDGGILWTILLLVLLVAFLTGRGMD